MHLFEKRYVQWNDFMTYEKYEKYFKDKVVISFQIHLVLTEILFSNQKI